MMVNGARHVATPAESLMERVLDRIKGTASVEVVYGEPRRVGSKTLIPVAVVGYGFGVGAGSGPAPTDPGSPIGGGGGGGGGVRVQPIAIVEVTDGATRVVPIIDWTAIIRTAIAVMVPLLAARAVRRLFRRG